MSETNSHKNIEYDSNYLKSNSKSPDKKQSKKCSICGSIATKVCFSCHNHFCINCYENHECG